MKAWNAFAVACALLLPQTAQGNAIKVLASGALHEMGLQLIPQFEKSAGHKVSVTWTGTAKIKEQIAAGEVFDLVIVGAPEVDKFISDGKLVAGSRVDLAKSGVGIAVKAGAPKPDVSSAEAVKKAMLAAKSVAYSTGPSGVYVHDLIGKLGIAEEMKAKAKQTTPGSRVGQYIARGEAELGFQQISELIHESGIDYLGPLPPDIQNYTNFSSGIGTGSKEQGAAKALQAFLSAPSAAAVIKKNGMDPAR